MDSMRTIWHSVLDQELTLLAQITQLLKRHGCVGRSLKQFRVDGTCLQGSKKVRDKVLALKDLTYAQLSPAPFAKHSWPKSDCQEKCLESVCKFRMIVRR